MKSLSQSNLFLEIEVISQILEKYNRLIILAGVAIVTWIVVFLVILKNMDKLEKSRKVKGKHGELKDIEIDIEAKRQL